MLVSDILKTKGDLVHAISRDHSITDAARLLSERKIGSVVVMESGRLVGILSERDIVRAIAARGSSCLSEQVAEVMTAKVVTCTRHQSISEVMEMMTEGRFRHVPVLEDGDVIGVISIGDVVKHRLDESQEEIRHLSAYVAGA
jgi:CBS domain-containing protein